MRFNYNFLNAVVRIIKVNLIIMVVLNYSLTYAETIRLKVAILSDGTHGYYHDLLKNSLEAIGHQVMLELSSEPLPQKRVIVMLNNGQLSLHYMVQSKERDQQYTPVEVGITNNLIGHRILFIPKGQQQIYDKVNSLEDFRALGKIGGFGINWFDVNVWKENNLLYMEKDGEWRFLYDMVASGARGVDYFSRGANEIVIEAPQHPNLDIEQRLVLIYQRDFRFYLASNASQYKSIIEEALQKAKESGLMNQLIRKYWSDVFEILKLDQRVRIELITP